MNMEQVKFEYSLKNIAIPTQKEYLIELINSVNIFLNSLKWRSFFFLNPTNKKQKETFGFKTTNSPPNIAELKEFEMELHAIVKNVTFRNYRLNHLQTKLNKDIKKLNNDEHICM